MEIQGQTAKRNSLIGEHELDLSRRPSLMTFLRLWERLVREKPLCSMRSLWAYMVRWHATRVILLILV